MAAINTLPRSEWPSTSMRAFFLYDTDHPASIEASVVAADRSHSTYIVTCPSSCAPSAFPEQTITHIEGSSWLGERTWDGTTTRWGCRLGNGGSDILTDQYGWCSAVTAAKGEVTEFPKSTAVNTCYVSIRSVPAIITAGMDKIYEDSGYIEPKLDAEAFNSLYKAELSSMGCLTTATTTTEESKSTAEASKGDESKTARETGSVAEATTTGGSEAEGTAAPTPTETSNKSPKMSVNKLAIMGSLLLGAWACV
ncbi:hypothetical protein N0V84_004741 [Fusarium piperis]|uniref:Uncharacterized protein n=1 Tax=Fusarium piperis TaxID=1435070 RepID=A0A9W9BR82_9HYPO|nr:hypothetical protein N0V84_004741 [Fusarium piperis]